MGRPRELTHQQRELLIAEGYRPIEVWVRDVTEWIEAVSSEAWDDL